MKRKGFSILFALVLVVSLTMAVALPVMAQPSEVWVDDDYYDGGPNDGHIWGYDAFDNIQDGVDAVAGSVVHVAAGTYAGAIVTKNVTISGAGGGGSVINSGVPYKTGGAYDTAFRLDPGADGAEINNFTVNNDQGAGFYFAVFASGVDDITVDSLDINDTVQGISNWGGSNWTITNNTITDTVAAGGGGIGIYLGAKPENDYSATPLPVCSDNLVQYNVVNATATATTYSCPGICLALDTRYGGYDKLTGDEDASGNQILDNTIIASGANNGVGIEVGTILGDSEEDPDRTDPVKIAAIMDAAAVHDNTVQDNTADGADMGIYFYNVINLTITENTVQNNVGYGMYAEHGQSGTVITDNTFTNNDVQLMDDTDDTDTLDPLDIATILSNNTFDRAVTVDHPGASLLHVIWSSTQDGIDAAVAGDTVNVAAGTYLERLVIDKQLTLQGAGSASTIIDATGGSPGIMLTAGGVSASQRLTIKGLTVKNSTPYHGIRAYKAGGLNLYYVTLEDVVLTLNAMNGMEIHNDVRVFDLEVTNCKFVGNGNVGLRTASNVVVEGKMTITDSKFNGNKWGIYLQGTINGVTILRSEFNNSVGGYGGYMTETGPLTNLVIEDSEFNNNVVGLMVWNVQDNEDITIRRSSFQNNDKWGVLIWGNTLTDVLIEGSTVRKNNGLSAGYYGIDFYAYGNVTTNVAVHFTDITGQFGGGGVKNRNIVDTAIVDATLNWWGDSSGPYDPLDTDGLNQYNPGGLGDAVSEYVLYDPWIGMEGTATGGGWIDSPPGAYMPGPTNIAGTFTGALTSRFTNIQCDPNNTPITFTGSVEVTGIQPNGAVMIGLIDQGLYDSGDSAWGSGAYLYLGRIGTNVRIGPSDGFMGGELNQVGANVPYVDGGPNLFNFSMTIYNGEITVTYDGTDYVDTYGEIEDANVYDAYPGNEFDSGAYVGLDSWPEENEIVYDIDISGCPSGPTGKATFGFVAKYKKGANVPDGQTEFVFRAADLNFHSSSYDWLVVTGSDYAKFKGTGTINGEGSYKFQLWAGDGDPDTFRIKIWEEDESDNETVIYDNGMDQAIGGGSIVVHKK